MQNQNKIQYPNAQQYVQYQNQQQYNNPNIYSFNQNFQPPPKPL